MLALPRAGLERRESERPGHRPHDLAGLGLAGLAAVAAGPLDRPRRHVSHRHHRAFGHGLAVRGLDDHAGQVLGQYPTRRELSRQPLQQERPDRLPRRRQVHLRPRFFHALPFPGAGRRRRRRSPQGTDRSPDQGRQVHRPGPDRGRRLGLRQRQGRRRLRRRLDHDHPGPGTARLPQRRHPRAQGDHRQGREVYSQVHRPGRRRGLQLPRRRRPPAHHRRRHRLPVQRRRI